MDNTEKIDVFYLCLSLQPRILLWRKCLSCLFWKRIVVTTFKVTIHATLLYPVVPGYTIAECWTFTQNMRHCCPKFPLWFKGIKPHNAYCAETLLPKVLPENNMSMSERKLFTAPLKVASLCHMFKDKSDRQVQSALLGGPKQGSQLWSFFQSVILIYISSHRLWNTQAVEERLLYLYLVLG